MAVLVLKPFAVPDAGGCFGAAAEAQRRPPRGGAQQKAPRPGIGRLPDDVPHTLEAEHGVVDEEGHHGTLREAKRVESLSFRESTALGPS